MRPPAGEGAGRGVDPVKRAVKNPGAVSPTILSDPMHVRRSASLLFCLTVSLLMPDWAQSAGAVRSGPPRGRRKKPPPLLFIQAGTLFTAKGRRIENGTILIRGDTIEKVGGPFLEPPPGAKVLRFPEGTAVPGFIDAAGGVLADPAEIKSLSGDDPSRSILDALDFFRPAWRTAVQSGVTACGLSPGPRSVLPGRGGVVRLTGGMSTSELALKQADTLEACLWPQATSFRRRPRRTGRPAQTISFFGLLIRVREGGLGATSAFDLLRGYRTLRSALHRAKLYRLRKTWYEQDLGAWERQIAKLKQEAELAKKQGKVPPRKPPPPKPQPPSPDPFSEALLPVIEGKRPLYLWAESLEEINLGLKLASEFSLRLVLLGAFEAHLVAAELARAGVGVVLIPPQAAPSLRPGLRIVRDQARRLFQADVQFGFGTGPAPSTGSHLLRHYVAEQIASGLDPDYALRALTLTNAELLGVDSRLGSLQQGKEAHVVVFDGDPLATGSKVLLSVAAGKIVYSAEGKSGNRSAGSAKMGEKGSRP